MDARGAVETSSLDRIDARNALGAEFNPYLSPQIVL